MLKRLLSVLLKMVGFHVSDDDRMDVEASRLKIEEAGLIEDQKAQAAEERVKVDSEVLRIRKGNENRKMEYSQQYERRRGAKPTSDEPAESKYEQVIALWLNVGALACVLLDSGVAALLARGGWLSVSPQAGAVAGAIIAGVLSLIFKGGLFGTMMRVTRRPLAVRRRMVVLTMITFVLTVVMAGIVLGSRTPLSGVIDVQIILTGLSFAALGLLLPLLAGELLVLGHDFNWSHYYAVEHRDDTRYLAQLNGFVEWVKRFLARNGEREDDDDDISGDPSLQDTALKPHRVDAKPADSERRVKDVGSVASLLAIVALGALTVPAHAAAKCADGLDLWMDDTASVNAHSREGVVTKLMVQLPLIIDSCGIRTVTVFHFSEKPWDEMGTDYAVPRRQLAACKGANVPSEITVLSPEMGKQAAAKAQARCQPEQDKKDEEFKIQFGNLLGAIRSDLLSRTSMGACTAVVSLLSRIARSSTGLNMIVGDGAETCRKNQTAVLKTTNRGGVYFLITSSTGDPNEAPMEDRSDQLGRVAPWLTVVLPFQKVADLIPGVGGQ